MEVRACVTVLGVALATFVAAAQPMEERADAVLEAALKGVSGELLTEEVRAIGTVACLQVDVGKGAQSISVAFLKRFSSLSFVRRGAQCEARPEGAVELVARGPALVLTAGPIVWPSVDEAHVTVKYFGSSKYSGTRVYRIMREPSGWVSLGQIIKMSPAQQL